MTIDLYTRDSFYEKIDALQSVFQEEKKTHLIDKKLNIRNQKSTTHKIKSVFLRIIRIDLYKNYRPKKVFNNVENLIKTKIYFIEEEQDKKKLHVFLDSIEQAKFNKNKRFSDRISNLHTIIDSCRFPTITQITHGAESKPNSSDDLTFSHTLSASSSFSSASPAPRLNESNGKESLPASESYSGHADEEEQQSNLLNNIQQSRLDLREVPLSLVGQAHKKQEQTPLLKNIQQSMWDLKEIPLPKSLEKDKPAIQKFRENREALSTSSLNSSNLGEIS